MTFPKRAALPLLLLILAVFAVLCWPGIQDDALIHLRYADHLRTLHLISYNGTHPDFGTSSLLYVAILAVLSGVFHTPNLPHIVSAVFSFSLVGGLGLLALRTPARARWSSFLFFFLAALFVTPSSVRWLQDGMETGLVLCFLAAWTFFLFVLSRADRITPGERVLLFLFAVTSMLLRVELLLLIALFWAVLVLARLRRPSAPVSLAQALLESAPLLLGAATSCAILLLTMGHILPDTAVAKAGGANQWYGVLTSTAIVLIGSFATGVGLLLFWLVSLLVLAVSPRRPSLATLLLNTLFPVVVLLSASRGQAIQGARYLLWTFFVPTLWNLLTLRETELATSDGATRSRSRPTLVLVSALVVAELLLLIPDVYFVAPMLRRRAHTMEEFRADRLGELAGTSGVAMDVGYIGYFTHANICDLAGLINGRPAAALNQQVRARVCLAGHPTFLFLNESQIALVNEFIDLRDWRVCGLFDLTNVRRPDPHWLLAPPGHVDQVCATTGASPEPLGALLTP